MGRTHGLSKTTKAYSSWLEMRRRCNVPTHPAYARYGGRGITICERWDSFPNFFEDMGERPPELSLDRIDSNGNYEPSNCRWATPLQQARNRRSNILITRDGETKCLWDWCKELQISYSAAKQRIRRGQMRPEVVLVCLQSLYWEKVLIT